MNCVETPKIAAAFLKLAKAPVELTSRALTPAESLQIRKATGPRFQGSRGFPIKSEGNQNRAGRKPEPEGRFIVWFQYARNER